MNYQPYFRGKQYELICIRENAQLIARNGFRPIIEPVRSATNGLIRCLEELVQHEASFVVIGTPQNGDFRGSLPEPLHAHIDEMVNGYEKGSWGVMLGEGISTESLGRWLSDHRKTTVIHSSGVSSSPVLEVLNRHVDKVDSNVFFEASCGRLYRSHFRNFTRILLRDGFRRRTNREHPDVEPFSDLHLTYVDEGAQGFGDFSIVGDEYLEAGGPAYTVALHITFIDEANDSAMFIHHFKSDTNDSPINPAGKFLEALTKLVEAVLARNSKILRTSAIEEFLRLHESNHYPGLGYAKKLCMQHHLELMGSIP